jgi:hypothetical protein
MTPARRYQRPGSGNKALDDERDESADDDADHLLRGGDLGSDRGELALQRLVEIGTGHKVLPCRDARTSACSCAKRAVWSFSTSSSVSNVTVDIHPLQRR